MKVEINYLQIPLTVKGVYHAEEPEVMYDSDMSGCPGYPSEFEIHDVLAGDISIIELLSDYQMDEIQSQTIEKIEG